MSVAVFLDFENLACTGPLQIEPIIDFVSTKGNVVLRRAYADWMVPRCQEYQQALLEQGFEFVYLPKTSSQGKNGSDVRLAVDVMELLELRPEIGTIVIGSGDTDFIPLIQKVRARCKDVVVVGFERAVGRLVKANTSQFKSLDELLALSSQPTAAEPTSGYPVTAPASPVTEVSSSTRPTPASSSSPSAKAPTSPKASPIPLVQHSATSVANAGSGTVASAPVPGAHSPHKEARLLIERFLRNYSDTSISMALLKPQLTRLDPSFSERKYGFASFKSFVSSLVPDLVSRIETEGGMHCTVHFRDDRPVRISSSSDVSPPTPTTTKHQNIHELSVVSERPAGATGTPKSASSMASPRRESESIAKFMIAGGKQRPSPMPQATSSPAMSSSSKDEMPMSPSIQASSSFARPPPAALRSFSVGALSEPEHWLKGNKVLMAPIEREAFCDSLWEICSTGVDVTWRTCREELVKATGRTSTAVRRFIQTMANAGCLVAPSSSDQEQMTSVMVTTAQALSRHTSAVDVSSATSSAQPNTNEELDVETSSVASGQDNFVEISHDVDSACALHRLYVEYWRRQLESRYPWLTQGQARELLGEDVGEATRFLQKQKIPLVGPTSALFSSLVVKAMHQTNGNGMVKRDIADLIVSGVPEKPGLAKAFMQQLFLARAWVVKDEEAAASKPWSERILVLDTKFQSQQAVENLYEMHIFQLLRSKFPCLSGHTLEEAMRETEATNESEYLGSFAASPAVGVSAVVVEESEAPISVVPVGSMGGRSGSGKALFGNNLLNEPVTV